MAGQIAEKRGSRHRSFSKCCKLRNEQWHMVRKMLKILNRIFLTMCMYVLESILTY